MSKSLVNPDFIPMFGYKDIFYSPGNNTTNTIKDWCNSKSLVKKTIFREPDIHIPYIVTQSPIYTCRLNIINKGKLNFKTNCEISKITTKDLISPITIDVYHPIDNIYQIIKDKIIEISISNSTDKINKMADNIIKLCKDANIDEHSLGIFLDTL
jgi:hypothetical protein